MKKQILIFCWLLLGASSFSQVNLKTYHDLINVADSLAQVKDFKNAAATQSRALNILGKRANVAERMDAAVYFTIGGMPDSAFNQLQELSISDDIQPKHIDWIVLDDDLTPMHSDSRWEPMLNQLFLRAYKNFLLAQNEGKKISNLNKKQIAFAAALRNHSDSAYAHLNDKAYSYLKNNMYGKAYKLFKLSIDFFSPNAILYRNMMDYYIDINDKDRAYVYFSRAQVVQYKNEYFLSDTVLNLDSVIKTDYAALSNKLQSDIHPPEYLIKIVATAYMNAGMIRRAYTLFKWNVDLYPESYTTNKDYGTFFLKTGNKVEADNYNKKSLIIQYNLPENFFAPGFDVEQYLIARNDSMGGKPGTKPMPPEPFIDDVANEFVQLKMLDKAERLFQMNVDNYPTSYYANKSMSNFYKNINNKIKEDQFELLAQDAKEKYGMRRNRVFKNGPIADTTFDISVQNPVCKSNCPNILIDYVHNNITVATAEEEFKPLYKLLTNDGFNVKKNYGFLTTESLVQVNVLVLKGGMFTQSEIDVVKNWVQNGGALLTFTHHHWSLFDPVLQSFGVQTNEIEITEDSLHGLIRDGFNTSPLYIYISETDSLLGNHVILRGRDESERIRKIQTLASKTIVGPPGSSILLKLSPSAVDFMSIDLFNGNSKVPVSTKGNRSLGIAFTYGKGRVVVTDAWALMALLFENSERGKMGMNTPGNDNKQFALNIVRWLTRFLK